MGFGVWGFSTLSLVAATHVAPSGTSPQPGPQITQTAPPPELPKTVERLSAQPSLSAADCATLANQTIELGESIRQAGQPVKPGIVQDGLDAVSLGERLDEKRANWPELRSKLQELLRPPPPEDKKDEKQQEQDKEQDKKQEQQQNQENPSQQDKEQEKSQDGKQPQQDQPKPQDEPKSPESKPADQPPSEPQTQQVGGEPPPNQELRDNPQLAEPLQKLEQVRDQDKPATLHQLMHDNDPKPAARPKKDW